MTISTISRVCLLHILCLTLAPGCCVAAPALTQRAGLGGRDRYAHPDPRVLEIHGDQVHENAGSEIWIANVAFSSPHDNPENRENAGTPHMLLGKNGQ